MTQTQQDASPTDGVVRAGRLPVHPPVAHISIGAYATGVICDILSFGGVGGVDTRHDLFQAGTYALMIATAALFVAVAAGLVERSRRTTPEGKARHKVNIHAVIMGVTGVLAIIDIVLRRHTSASAAHTPTDVLILTLIIAVLLIVGGKRGANLVYKLGIGGVRRS